MAATVGASIASSTAGFPNRHSGIGPFISSGGNTYLFARSFSSPGQVIPFKATDPMSAFTTQTAKTVSSATGTTIEAMRCEQNGNTVYVFTQLATGAVLFNFYTMDTDTWGLVTSATTIAAAGFAPTTGYTFVSAVYRPTAAELVLGYCAGLTAMSSGFNMVRYARVNASTGVVIGSVANVDNGGSVNWTNPIAVLGASDRVHFFISDQTNDDAYQRTLSAANALQTFPASYYTTLQGFPMPGTNGVSYVDTGVTKVRAQNYGLTTVGDRGMVVRLDSADTPTIAFTKNINDIAMNSVNSQGIQSLASDGATLHFLYSDVTSQDLQHDTSTDGGVTWGTDVNELAGTINRITSNVYTRAGTKYLAMVLDDAGTIKYAEITLAAAAQTSFPFAPPTTPQSILALR